MNLEEKGKQTAAAFLAAAFTALSLLTPAYAAEEKTVVALGKSVGIKLFAEGALVVAVEDSPVLQKGDVLLSLDGAAVSSTEEVQSLVEENGGAVLTMAVQRGEEVLQLRDTPRLGADGVWRLGVWVRDSMAGVGTLTYYDPQSGLYGALGHGINDVDTMHLMPLQHGAVMATQVRAVEKGAPGAPGELRGDFSVQRHTGTLTANTDRGIFGAAEDRAFFTDGPTVKVAERQEITCGAAEILCTVSGDTPKSYSVELLRLYDGAEAGRDMLLQVTDPALLSLTGGIVQGMSGSPIIQDGKLIGAVTHVLINDPTRGYGIYIENMMEAS